MRKHTDPSFIVGCEFPKNKRFKNLTGKTFGRLVVLGLAGKRIRGSIDFYWNCVCLCGRTATISGSSLKSNHASSCGCYQIERLIATVATHRMSNTAEYGAWRAMKSRCINRNAQHWKNYGGRGITVCERWLNFQNFYADMGPRTTPKHTLERRNNENGYSPENCYWATQFEQARNTRASRILEFQGRTLCVPDWSALTGIAKQTIYYRVYNGWSAERALTTPVKSPPPSHR